MQPQRAAEKVSAKGIPTISIGYIGGEQHLMPSKGLRAEVQQQIMSLNLDQEKFMIDNRLLQERSMFFNIAFPWDVIIHLPQR